MIETMKRSTGRILGYTVSGDVTKADYQTLVPAVEAAIEQHGSVSLLFLARRLRLDPRQDDCAEDG